MAEAGSAEEPFVFKKGDEKYVIDPTVVLDDDLRCMLWTCLEIECLPIYWHAPADRTRAKGDVAHSANLVKYCTPLLTMFDKVVACTNMPANTGLGLMLEIWFPNKDINNPLRVDLIRTVGARGAIKIVKTSNGNDTILPSDDGAEQSTVVNSKRVCFKGLKAQNVLVNFLADYPQAMLTLPGMTTPFMVGIDIGASRTVNPFREPLAALCLQNYVIAINSTRPGARLMISHPTT